MEHSASISMAMKAQRAAHISPFCANCADGLLRAELFAELVPAVVAGMHDDCSLFDPSLKRCVANCDGLASFGVGRQVNCSPVPRYAPEVPPDEVGLVRPSEDA